MPKPQLPRKSSSVAKLSNIPWLGRTTLIALYQRKLTELATSSNWPKLSAYLPHNILPWVWNWIKHMFQRKYCPYPTYDNVGDNGVYPLHSSDGSEDISICIAGDWGTGTHEAAMVASAIKTMNPDYTIHLGDIYFVGDDAEVEENFLGEMTSRYTPVCWPKGKVGTFAMLGNHEMYDGGRPYFTKMLSYCETGIGTRQQASFFCLESNLWRLIAIDTGYNSVGLPILGSIPWIRRWSFVGADCRLEDGLIDWLRRTVKPHENRKPTLLLSHHQCYTAFSDEVFGRPIKQLEEFFAGQELIWIFGHEHRLAIYNLHSAGSNIRAYGRCLGHGGMPVECEKPKIGRGLQFFDPRCNYSLNTDGSCAGWNGFVYLTLNRATLTLDYRDLNNRRIFSEIFLVRTDNTIECTSQTPTLLKPGP